MSSPSFYQIRECENAGCGLRYPLTEGHPFGERCPACLGATRVVLQRGLDAEAGFLPGAGAGRETRAERTRLNEPTPNESTPNESTPNESTPNRPAQNEAPNNERVLEALLDNVRSAWNVGAIFRTADAFGVRRIHLCGVTPTPENKSVGKTALGAEKTIAWTAGRNALVRARALMDEGCVLWGLEQDERAVSTTDFFSTDFFTDSRIRTDGSSTDSFTDSRIKTDLGPIVLIVGNEVTGVDPGLLDLCEKILYIPMRGRKRSLNVEVAFGVALSWLTVTGG
ncbi:MAG: TrmH family RNA methyltransferase [Anaerolineales bacterium]